jgi:pimeloyl-ACP methyl ester carboxylesterase
MFQLILPVVFLMLTSCANSQKKSVSDVEVKPLPSESGYLKVNGTDLFYESYGQGEPLVLLHGGGSDIHVSFGKSIAALSKEFRVLAFDEQGHGKSPATSRAFGFENTADDIAAALKQLKIDQAMFVGFSNGATTGMYLAIRHPRLMRKMVLGSGLYKKDGAPAQFWEWMKQGTLESMPQELKDAYVKRSPHPEDLSKMFEYDATRMRTFKDIPEKLMRSVSVPVLIMQTDQDVPTVEHGVFVARLLPQGRIAIFPGPHDNFLGDVTKASPQMTAASLAVITEFLKNESK